MSIRQPGRVAAVAILSLATAGATLSLSQPARAAADQPKYPDCTTTEYFTWLPHTSDPSSLYAYGVINCTDPPLHLDLTVTIYREEAGNKWVVVATGTGSTQYLCQGHASNVYSSNVSGNSEYTLNCG